MGQGLLVYYAAKEKESGKSLVEVAAWLEGNKNKMNHWFTVDDLFHLKRGGRVSSAAAIVGGMLNIKMRSCISPTQTHRTMHSGWQKKSMKNLT